MNDAALLLTVNQSNLQVVTLAWTSTLAPVTPSSTCTTA